MIAWRRKEISHIKKKHARHCLMSVILGIWETEIRRIGVQGKPRKIINEAPSPK
jgi:hypothetical protein